MKSLEIEVWQTFISWTKTPQAVHEKNIRKTLTEHRCYSSAVNVTPSRMNWCILEHVSSQNSGTKTRSVHGEWPLVSVRSEDIRWLEWRKTHTFCSPLPKSTGWMYWTLSVFFRNPLSKVVRVRRGLPHRLIRLPAVLHGPPQLGLYHLLQHATLQRPKEEEARPVCGRAKPTPGKNTAPLDALFTPNDAPILHIDTSIWQQIDLQCTVSVP